MVAAAAKPFHLRGGNIDVSLSGKPPGGPLPGPDIPVVIVRRELGDPERPLRVAEVGFRPRTAEGGSRSDQHGEPAPKLVQIVDILAGQFLRNGCKFSKTGDRRRGKRLVGQKGLGVIEPEP